MVYKLIVISTSKYKRNCIFSYETLSRLPTAKYYEKSSNYTTSYGYDLMGNILTLKRNGLLDDGSYATIDDLTYTYDGNQVIKIDDSAEETPCYNGAMHFVDNADKDEEYTYDANGNMTTVKAPSTIFRFVARMFFSIFAVVVG